MERRNNTNVEIGLKNLSSWKAGPGQAVFPRLRLYHHKLQSVPVSWLLVHETHSSKLLQLLLIMLFRRHRIFRTGHHASQELEKSYAVNALTRCTRTSPIGATTFVIRLVLIIYGKMNGLSFSELCCLFCCPPCPSRIAAKLAFLPPEPTYEFVSDENGKCSFALTERAEWQFSEREKENVEVTVLVLVNRQRKTCMPTLMPHGKHLGLDMALALKT
ncbi:hypothetical protein NQ318_020662 [Aromia moschata]|uniref:Uncharacterized protein n=1 Tax=Aromia moschata TaxID=1265417 RepID=A0AAV8XY67_9CUCU|nr:hypothetical protein NQ318_020662 [Aromia moschata]